MKMRSGKAAQMHGFEPPSQLGAAVTQQHGGHSLDDAAKDEENKPKKEGGAKNPKVKSKP